VRQPHPAGHDGGQGQHRRVGGHDRVEPHTEGHDPAGGAVGVGGADVHDWVIAEWQRPVAAHNEAGAHPGGRGEKIGRAVGTGGHQQQHLRRRQAGIGVPAGRTDLRARPGRGHRFSGEKNGCVPAS
jgi:hypothetical protein